MKQPKYHISLNGQELSETDLDSKIITDETLRTQLDADVSLKLSNLEHMESDCLNFYDKKTCGKMTEAPRKIYQGIRKKIDKTKQKQVKQEQKQSKQEQKQVKQSKKIKS